jgi:hypothetical protein
MNHSEKVSPHIQRGGAEKVLTIKILNLSKLSDHLWDISCTTFLKTYNPSITSVRRDRALSNLQLVSEISDFR